MKIKKGLLFILFLRGFGLVIFLILVISMVYYLWFAREKMPIRQTTPASSTILNQRIESLEGVKFIAFQGEMGRLEAQAARHLALSDGQYRLEGEVQIHDFGRRPELEAWLSCDQATYASDWSRVVLSGNVKLKRKGGELSSEQAVYLRANETFEAEGQVCLKIKRITALAEILRYSLLDEIIQLKNGVSITWDMGPEEKIPYLLQGESVVYDRPRRHGRVEGNVRLAHGENSGEAGWAELTLSEDENSWVKFELGGGVKGKGRSDSLLSEISASAVKARPFLNSYRLHALETEGNTELRFLQDEGATTFSAEKMVIVFDRWGKLREIRSEIKAAWKKKDIKTGEEQVVTGEKIEYLVGKNHLYIFGGGGERARLASGQATITAENMTLNVKTRDLEAVNDVRVTINPEEKQNKTKEGLFTSAKPFYGQGELLLFSMSQNWFSLQKSARVWQEDTSLQAEKITMDEKTQEIEAQGQVKLTAVRKPTKEAEKRRAAQINSSRFRYLPSTRAMEFSGDSELRSEEMVLSAEKIVVFFQPEATEIDRLEAQGQVKLSQGQTKAEGEKGWYYWEKEVVILEGKPMLFDPNKGLIRGDKLTFHLADGRILVENQGRERSISVIKKEE